MKAVRIGTILMLLSGSLLVNSSVYAQEKEPIQDVSEKIAVKATNEAKTFEEWFEDRDLSSSVAHVFGKNRTDTITQAELARVTELPVGEGFGLSGVTSFKGIEHLTNLTRLYVHYNSTLQDLTPLAKAKNLEYLELSCRALEDISPLANLPNLTTLYLEDTLVEDITPLANITTLNTLGIYETRNYRDEHGLVSDLTPLQNLSELRRLTIYRQSVKELPEGFSQLNLYSLDMSDNVIQDIGMLQGMKNLYILDLSVNQIEDVTPLRDLVNTKYLDLTSNKIKDVTPLQGLEKLSLLRIYNNKIADFSSLGKLKLDEFGADMQYVTLPTQKVVAGEDLVVPDQIRDIKGNRPEKITPDNGGSYDAEEGVIRWKGLVGEGEVFYEFSSPGMSGEVTIPYEVVKERSVRFYKNDGEQQAPIIKSVLPGERVTEIASPSRAGYEFLGWYRDIDGQLTPWGFEQDVMPDENILLQAKWQLRSFELDYDGNGADNLLPEKQSFDVSEGVRITSVTPTREGYKFIGWNTEKDGSGQDYLANDVLRLANDTILYAQWEKQNYAYHLIGNGGDLVGPTSQQVGFGELLVPPEDPIREGYTFTGWMRETGEEQVLWDFNTMTMPATEIWLVAQWKKNPPAPVNPNPVEEKPEQPTLEEPPSTNTSVIKPVKVQAVGTSQPESSIINSTTVTSFIIDDLRGEESTLKGSATEEQLPKTGDTSISSLWLILLGSSAVFLGIQRLRK
ncbi:InlB B-repeat-containing protein [Listeria weihenstephanensis]|nr:InlB B-repeat-containing protein [Listeria weihenstephanensis]